MTTFFNAQAQALTSRAAEKMADVGISRVHELTKMNTPVKSGHLRESWKKIGPIPDMAEGEPSFRGSVETNVEYAPYVEYGTGLYGPKHAPYVIKPRNPGGTLRFMVNGRIVFAKAVLHPGSPGNFMLEIGMSVTYGEMHDGAMFGATLEEWVRGVEGSAHG